MPGLTVGQLCKARIWTRLPAAQQAAVNTLWYIVAAAGSPPATDLDLAQQLDGNIQALYKAMMTNAAEYRGVQVQICDPTPPNHALFVEANTNANAGAGGIAGAILPHQTCGLISFQTLNPGQAGRGRFYTAFPAAASDSGGGSPNATYITDLTTLAGLVDSGQIISVSGRTATLVRIIRHGKNKAGTFPAPSPIATSSVSDAWATQRRRGSFGRTNKSPI